MSARIWFAFLTATLLAACNSSTLTPPFETHASRAPQDDSVGSSNSVTLRSARSARLEGARLEGRAKSPIHHVVLIIQENRTFNDFFATFPGADGTTTGKAEPNSDCHITKEKTITLKENGLLTKLDGKPQDLIHSYQGYVVARDGGKMDGFDSVLSGAGRPECLFPYQYTNPDDIKPYWDMAKQYALAEHMFTTQGSSSFTAHQDLIAGNTVVAPNEAIVNLPSCSGANCVWGCDAPSGTHTSLITRKDVFKGGKGPFPCLEYRTIRDLLDAKHVSWRYYAPQMCCAVYGKLLSAFDAIKAVRDSSQWTDGHISTPQTNIFSDLTNHKLQNVSWVVPDENESDHPGTSSDTGPSWVASVVNAIGESSYWNSTAIVIVWDDWGGLYDDLNPPQKGYGGLGFRVPAIVVSPYAKPAYISTTQYEFGSILKYIEGNWDLGSLHTTDQRSTSISNCFDYTQTPIPFTPIASKYSTAYFLTQPPSFAPPDTDF